MTTTKPKKDKASTVAEVKAAVNDRVQGRSGGLITDGETLLEVFRLINEFGCPSTASIGPNTDTILQLRYSVSPHYELYQFESHDLIIAALAMITKMILDKQLQDSVQETKR